MPSFRVKDDQLLYTNPSGLELPVLRIDTLDAGGPSDPLIPKILDGKLLLLKRGVSVGEAPINQQNGLVEPVVPGGYANWIVVRK